MLHCEYLIEKNTDAVLNWMHVAAENSSFKRYYLTLGINSSGDRIGIGLRYLGAIDEKRSTLPEDRAYIWLGNREDRNIAGFDVGKERYEIVTQSC